MEPLFSVVIPLYNKESVIERAIHSVLSQTIEDYEIIVVNDGSTDNSQQEVEKLDNPKIKLYVQKNQGVSAARNKGIEIADGKYIAFLDGDDVWEPNHLNSIKQLIKIHPRCGYYATAHEIIMKGGKVKNINFGFRKEYKGIIKRYFKHSAQYERPGWTSSIVVPKNIFYEIGNFDEEYLRAEDDDMWNRIALKYPVAFSNIVTAKYMQDDEQVERISIHHKKLKTDEATEGLIERLLRLKNTYHRKKYIEDIDVYIANYLLKNTISAVKKEKSNKIYFFFQRVKKIKKAGINYKSIFYSFYIILNFSIHKKIKKFVDE